MNQDPPSAFILGSNTNTLAFICSFTPGEKLMAYLVPLAWTPVGAVIGNAWQTVQIAGDNFLSWLDQTFPAEDERSFLAPLRDIEMLARTQWSATPPEALSLDVLLNAEDVPEDLAQALQSPSGTIVQCAACRRLCVKDEFAWKDRQLCAWDYHAQVFGRRGPWRNEAYENRYFETLPTPAYVAPPLLVELGVEVVLATGNIDDELAKRIVNDVLEFDKGRAHLAVRTDGGYTILREVAR